MDIFGAENKKLILLSFQKQIKKKKVYKYDKFGKLLEKYNSITEAANKNNSTVGKLTTAIQGQNFVNK